MTPQELETPRQTESARPYPPPPASPEEQAQHLLDFVNASPSPYHAVASAEALCLHAGAIRLYEQEEWTLEPGSLYYVIRGDTSLIAFRPGSGSPVRHGFRLIGAHTDSPNLRLKPKPMLEKEGMVQLGVEIYGGVLLHSWLDRDLGISGRLITHGLDGTLQSVTVRLDEPLCRISSLAIHLDREVNDRGLVLNRQTQLAPMLALGNKDASRQALFESLARSAGVDQQAVVGWDLGLHPLVPATLGGLNRELIFAPRLDNQASCHAGLLALFALQASGIEVPSTAVLGLFDHEEVGSGSAQGAGSSFLRSVLSRVVDCQDPTSRSGLERALACSHSISADMAHAANPNYLDKHEPQHMPKLGQGPVIKSNVQQRYASDGLSMARFSQVARAAQVPVQNFVTRTDLACGTTIGPITSALTGISTVDIGSPMLSMHSSRECAATSDHALYIRVLQQHLMHGQGR